MILSIVIFIMSHEKQFNEIMNETNLFEINKSISNVSNFNLMENIMWMLMKFLLPNILTSLFV